MVVSLEEASEELGLDENLKAFIVDLEDAMQGLAGTWSFFSATLRLAVCSAGRDYPNLRSLDFGNP